MLIIIGKNGQLARALAQECKLLNQDFLALGREDINLSSFDEVLAKLKHHSASAVINASAYTAVDKAESDETAAFELNHHAVEVLAKCCAELNIHAVHVSTDYVFAGDKGSPYLPSDSTAPQGTYGASKAAGEQALLSLLPNNACVLRTSWVYSSEGNNFVKTMLRLMQEKPELGVIDDQIGSPTSAATLAKGCIEASQQKLTGIHHITDEGIASWFDFAVAIQSLAIEKGLLVKQIPIKAIPSSAYPTPVRRPHYSVLSKQSLKSALPNLELPYWRKSLGQVLDQIKQSSHTK